MINGEDLVVEVRSKVLTRQGQIRLADLNMEIQQNFNGVDTWSLSIAAEHPMAKVLKTPGSGIVVSYRGAVIMSGPMTEWVVKQTSEDSKGTVQVTGVSDDVNLWDRIVFPEPQNLDLRTQKESHDVATGNAEDLLYYYTSRQMGPLSHSDRTLSRFRCTIDDSGRRGPTITRRARFPVLGDFLYDIATPNEFGFRIFHDSINGVETLRFSTYQVRDRTKYVRMSVENNMASSTEAHMGGPSITDAVIAGQGQGVARNIVLYTDADAQYSENMWGRRIERFIDQRQTNDRTELLRAGFEALSEGGKTFLKVKAVPLEDSAANYGRDWMLGDKITVIIDGVEYQDIVTGMIIKAGSEGVFGAVKIGLEEDRDVFRSLKKRIGHLERNAEVRQSSYSKLDRTNSPAGRWVRVAYCPGSNGKAPRVASDFTITASQSGSHDFLNFRAASLFLDCTITLLDYAAFNDNPTFTAARFVRDPSSPTYGDGYLELFVSDSLARDGDARVEIHTSPGPHVVAWEPVTPEPSPVTDSSWVEVQVGLGTTRSKTLTLRNGWSHRGDEYEPAQFIMGNGSVVYLQGAVDGSSAVGDTVATLPPGYRPAKHLDCAVATSNDQTVRLTVESNGNIKILSSESRGFTPLTGVTFQATH